MNGTFFNSNPQGYNWTPQMISKFDSMIKEAGLTKSKNGLTEQIFKTFCKVLRDFYKEVQSNPQQYGVSIDNRQSFVDTKDEQEFFNFLQKDPPFNNSKDYLKSFLFNIKPSANLAISPQQKQLIVQQTKELAQQMNKDLENIEQPQPPANTNDDQEKLNNEAPEDEKVAYTGQFLIWPLNPRLPGIRDEFDRVVKAIEKYKGYTVIVTSLNKGGDGQFDIGSFNQFKHHKTGVSFGTSEKNSISVTSWKTFAKYIIDNQTSSKITESHSKLDLSLKLLNEGDSNIVDTKTAQVGDSKIKTNVGDIKFNKNIHIVCSPEMETSMKKDGFLDLLKPLEIDVNNCIVRDPNLSTPKTVEAGKIIFKTFLEYINGKKAGSAAVQDTADTLTSQKMNESTSLKEADNPQPDTDDWSWENLKVNTGAKEYINGLYSSVKAIKDGLDDGGNPSMASRIFKQIVTEVGKEWGAALTDGADFMMQGLGLGWMMPLIKAGIETQRNEAPNKEFEGLEALVRSEEFKNLTAYFGDPKAFIEKGAN